MTTRRINSNTVLFYALESIIDSRLHELSEYFDAVEGTFDKNKDRIKERYEKEVGGKSLDPETAQSIAEFYGEELYQIDEIFVTNLRYAMIVSMYSVLEELLMNLCRHLRYLKKISLELNELRGEGIVRSRLYLTKICKVNFPGESYEWNEIVKLNKVRNCIVHALGKVGSVKNNERLFGLIKSTKGLCFDSTGKFIRVNKSYIVSSISCLERFAHILLDAAFESVRDLE